MSFSQILVKAKHTKASLQKMKVLLGRLLAFRPKNLLLDEPTSGLDVMATRSLRKVLRNLRDEGHCLVFSSHVMQEVELLADSVIVMHNGHSLVQGSVSDLYRQTGQDSMEEAFVSLIAAPTPTLSQIEETPHV